MRPRRKTLPRASSRRFGARIVSSTMPASFTAANRPPVLKWRIAKIWKIGKEMSKKPAKARNARLLEAVVDRLSPSPCPTLAPVVGTRTRMSQKGGEWPTGVASGSTGVRATAVVPLRARKWLHLPEQTFLFICSDLVGDRPATIEIGAKVVGHARTVAFHMAEVAISKNLFAGLDGDATAVPAPRAVGALWNRRPA